MAVYGKLLESTTSSYDGGYVGGFDEMNLLHSVALEEYQNYKNILESCTDMSQIPIIEAKLDVLQEISIKDIGDKIKKFFRFIRDKIKEIIDKIMGLFRKKNKQKLEKETKELKDRIEKEFEPINNIAKDIEKLNKDVEESNEKLKEVKLRNTMSKIVKNNAIYFDMNNYVVDNPEQRLNKILTIAAKLEKEGIRDSAQDFATKVGEDLDDALIFQEKVLSTVDDKEDNPFTKLPTAVDEYIQKDLEDLKNKSTLDNSNKLLTHLERIIEEDQVTKCASLCKTLEGISYKLEKALSYHYTPDKIKDSRSRTLKAEIVTGLCQAFSCQLKSINIVSKYTTSCYTAAYAAITTLRVTMGMNE